MNIKLYHRIYFLKHKNNPSKYNFHQYIYICLIIHILIVLQHEMLIAEIIAQIFIDLT